MPKFATQCYTIEELYYIPGKIIVHLNFFIIDCLLFMQCFHVLKSLISLLTEAFLHWYILGADFIVIGWDYNKLFTLLYLVTVCPGQCALWLAEVFTATHTLGDSGNHSFHTFLSYLYVCLSKAEYISQSNLHVYNRQIMPNCWRASYFN